MQLSAFGETFDCGDMSALAANGQKRAALHRLAIDMHRAAAALCGVAADMRSGEAQMFAQKFNEQCARIDVPADRLSVHNHGHNGHVLLPPSGRSQSRHRSARKSGRLPFFLI